MTKEFFPQIGKIPFEGKDSKNVMAFHYYQPDKVVMGKTMKEWLKFAMAWWHTLGDASGDQFGGSTRTYEWNKANDAIQRAKDKMDAGFEIMKKLGIEYFCFHDIDLIEEGDTIEEYEARMKAITDYALEKMKEAHVKLLWGTANVFSNKRYMNGAATNPNFDVVARAAVQIKNAIDATIKLGVLFHIHLIALIACVNAALCADALVLGVDFALTVIATGTGSIADSNLCAGVLLFVSVALALLYALNGQVLGINLYAFANDLGAFDGAVASALDKGSAAFVANMAMALGYTIAIAVAFADIAACGKA